MNFVAAKLQPLASDAEIDTPLRVALFSGNYNYVRDGANQSLNRLVDYLERHDIPVRVYSPTVADPAFPPAGDLISVPSIAIPRRREYRLGLGLPKKVVRDIERFAPTLFHISAPDLIGNAAIKVAHKLGRPAVASYHTRFETYFKYYGLGFLEPWAINYLRTFYRRCEQLYAPSECMASVLRGQEFNDDIRIWTRRVELTRFNPAKRSDTWRRSVGLNPDDAVIAFVGRLVLEKGLGILRDVAASLAGRGVKVRYLIVGDGPEREMLQAAMPDAVFTGLLTGDALPQAYASADIFFNPSTTETFGNVTLEAMASGLATVCAAATGSRSLVANGKTGLLATPGDVDAFASAIHTLIIDPDMRRAMGHAGRAASARYDWDRVLGDLVAHYRGVLARRRTVDAPELQRADRTDGLRWVEE
jgi:glycosyltransferase involved in cell wall biosynthesis